MHGFTSRTYSAVLAIPSAVSSRDSGLVDGRSGPPSARRRRNPARPTGCRGHIGVPLNPALVLAHQVLSCPTWLCPKLCLLLQDRTGAARLLSPDDA